MCMTSNIKNMVTKNIRYQKSNMRRGER